MPNPRVSRLGFGGVRLSGVRHTADRFRTLRVDDPRDDVCHDGDPVLLLAALYACDRMALAYRHRSDFGENCEKVVSARAA